MSELIIYHNPRCSKSRQTLQLLRDNHYEPQIVEYMKTPLSEQELADLCDYLECKPRAMMRNKEKLYKELNCDDPARSDEDLLHAMSEHPELIERPIVVYKKKAAIGRPAKNVLEIL
jgi:arsenate reductase (glutaredoxin)